MAKKKEEKNTKNFEEMIYLNQKKCGKNRFKY